MNRAVPVSIPSGPGSPPGMGDDVAEVDGSTRREIDSRARDRRIRLVSVTSIAARGSGVLVALVLTPFLVRGLGVVDYGIYETILSMVAWASLVQVGIGPSLVNALPSAIRGREHARVNALVATSLWSQAAMALVLVLGFAGLCAVIDPSVIVNAPPGSVADAMAAMTIAILAFASGLPGSLSRNVLSGFQAGHVTAALDVVTQLFMAAAIIAVVMSSPSLVTATAARVLPEALVLSAALLYIRRRFSIRLSVRCFRAAQARQLAGQSVGFFGIAVSGLVISSTDYLVIAHVVGPAAVTPYALTWKLGFVAILAIMAVLDAMWPAYRDAVAARDIAWIKTRHRQALRLSILTMLVTATLLTVFGNSVIAAWAGPSAAPSLALLCAVSSIFVLQGALLPVGRLLTSIGGVRENAQVAVLNAIVNLPLSLLLGYRFGAVGVACGTSLGYLAVGWLLFRYVKRRMRLLEEEVHDSEPQ